MFRAITFRKEFGTQQLEKLNCVRETTNSKDPYAVAVMRNSAIVGHVLCNMSAACALFLGR